MAGTESSMEASLGDKDPWEKHYEDVVKSQKAWWWMAHISISVIALLGNLVFLITIIYNRKRHELKTFVSAVIITIAALDLLDVLRVISVLVEKLFLEMIFRHVFCSMGVFHELAVAVLIVTASIAVCFQAGKETKYLASHKTSLVHKILIPVVLVLAAAAAAPFFLLPYDSISYTCTDAFDVSKVSNTRDEKFEGHLYYTLVAVFTYVLPNLILPICLPIAMLKTCLAGQCCVARFKQPIGEIIMVLLVGFIYLATVVFVHLPKLEKFIKMETIHLDPVPLLWELGNTAARPIIYFMTNPAVWSGVQALCCKKKNRLVNEEEEEIEVPLSPVTTV